MSFRVAATILVVGGWLWALRRWNQALDTVVLESEAMLSIYRRENRRLRRWLDQALPRTNGSKVPR